MTNDITIHKNNFRRLTDDEISKIYKHLEKGGHPTSAHHVVGLSLDELMNEFNLNSDFAKECSRLRANALAELEYALHETAIMGGPSSLKAIQMSLTANFPELYNVSSSKAQVTKLTLSSNEYLFIQCPANEVFGLAKALEEAMPECHERVIIHVNPLNFLKIEKS